VLGLATRADVCALRVGVSRIFARGDVEALFAETSGALVAALRRNVFAAVSGGVAALGAWKSRPCSSSSPPLFKT